MEKTLICSLFALLLASHGKLVIHCMDLEESSNMTSINGTDVSTPAFDWYNHSHPITPNLDNPFTFSCVTNDSSIGHNVMSSNNDYTCMPRDLTTPTATNNEVTTSLKSKVTVIIDVISLNTTVGISTTTKGKKSEENIEGVISGAMCGIVVGVSVILFIVCCCCKRCRETTEPTENNAGTQSSWV